MSERHDNPVLEALYGLPHRRPWTLLWAAVLLAALGGYLYAFHLPIESGREQLSDLDRPLNQRLERHLRDFDEPEYVIFVIAPAAAARGAPSDPPPPQTRAAMKRVARDLCARLEQRPDLFPEVVERIAPDEAGPLALLYLPADELDGAVAALGRAVPDLERWAEKPSLQSAFEIATESLNGLGLEGTPKQGARPAMAGAVALAEAFFAWLHGELASDEPERPLAETLAPLASAGDFDLEGHVFAGAGRLLLVFATVAGDTAQPNEFGAAMAYGWQSIEEAVAAAGGGAVDGGLAGIPALESEEVTTSQEDFARGAVIALVLVSLLFMATFGSVVRPALAALCLGLSIGITFVFAWLVVGHLNLLALVFAIILVALGVDFAIHFATHYERGLAETVDPRRAVRRTLARIGSALWLGGLTSAAAFLAAGATEAPGLSELGIIAGGGLLICLAVMWFVYPGLLYLIDCRWEPSVTRAARAMVSSKLPASRSATGRALCLLAVIAAGLGYAFGQYAFNTNLLALLSTEERTASWQRTLLAVDDRTQFAIATYPDRASLERARDRLEAAPELVRSTESVFPVDEEHKRQLLAPLCTELQGLEVAAAPEPSVRGTRRALFGLRQAVRRLRRATPEAESALAGLDHEIELAYTALSDLTEEVAVERLAKIETELTAAARAALARLETLCCPPAFELGRVPDVLRQRLVGRSGEFALLVYPEPDTWSRPGLERFVTGALEIEPNLFGGAVNFLDNAHTMIRSFAEASVYALVAVLLLLLAWFRSWRDTALAVFPLLTSIGLLLGLMRWSPWPVGWNFANFFALPILIGIGVDSGIHLTRAWHESAATFAGSRRAVLVSTLTTLTGFGVLAFSRHVGIASLGIVLSLGIALVLVTSVFLLPAVLSVLAGPAPKS